MKAGLRRHRSLATWKISFALPAFVCTQSIQAYQEGKREAAGLSNVRENKNWAVVDLPYCFLLFLAFNKLLTKQKLAATCFIDKKQPFDNFFPK